MEDKKLTVLDTWFECIGVTKGEKTSFNYKPRGHKEL